MCSLLTPSKARKETNLKVQVDLNRSISCPLDARFILRTNSLRSPQEGSKSTWTLSTGTENTKKITSYSRSINKRRPERN